MSDWDSFKATVKPLRSDVIALSEPLMRRREFRAQDQFRKLKALVQSDYEIAIQRLCRCTPESRQEIRELARQKFAKLGSPRPELALLLELLRIVDETLLTVGRRPTIMERYKAETESREALKAIIGGRSMERMVGATQVTNFKSQGTKKIWGTRRKRRP